MKKQLLFLSLLPLMLLAACDPHEEVSSSNDQSSSSIKEGRGDYRVDFYLNYNRQTTSDIYYTIWVDEGEKLTAPDEPKANDDLLFTVFVGWSPYPFAERYDQIWDFENDTYPSNTHNLYMYGIWLREGESLI